MNETTTTWRCSDGTELTGTWFCGPAPHTALLVNSGTGIPRRFYARFARFAAERGFTVLTYDYRGIGDSALGELSMNKAVYRDWGQLDMTSAIRHVRTTHPALPLTVVGHSTGGQQLGLASNVGDVDAAVFVGVSTGYWRGMPTRQKWFTLLLWKALVPLTSAWFGYVPAKRLGLGEDLPTGVAKEWGDWCLEPDYMAAYFDGTGRRACRDGRPFGTIHFSSARFPIRALCFTDDDIATPANVPPMLGCFADSAIDVHWIDPDALGTGPIGHLGFFRQHSKPLWAEPLDWLKATAGPA